MKMVRGAVTKLWLGVLVALGAIWLDPYSHGLGGELDVFGRYPMRIGLAVILAVLLLLGLGLAAAGYSALGKRLLATELLMFMITNAFWVAENGTSRFLWGYNWGHGGVLVLAAALIGRALAIRQLIRLDR